MDVVKNLITTEKLKLSLKGLQGPSAPAKVQPAFESNAFDLITLQNQEYQKEGETEAITEKIPHKRTSEQNITRLGPIDLSLTMEQHAD